MRTGPSHTVATLAPLFRLTPLAVALMISPLQQVYAADRLSLPAQIILGGGDDGQDLQLPLARHT
ncbi:hypothetical protein, partial [Pseudomonas sp. MYb185]|uniref:hypothetical protein n=1 Tax=Pseudomonas sp. MYb185 TaxID=1848729 RepID=UPI000D2CC24F